MRQLIGLPVRLHAQVAGTLIAGFLAARLVGASGPPAAGWIAPLLLLLVLAAALCSSPRLEWELRGQRVTLAVLPVFLGQLLLGTGPAVMVAGLGALADSLLNPEGKRARRIGEAGSGYSALFHFGNACTAASLAGLAYGLLRERLPALPAGQAELSASIGWALVYLGALTLNEALAVHFGRDYALQSEWIKSLTRWGPAVLDAVAASLATLALVRAAGPLGAVAVVVALYLAYFSHRFYTEKSAAARQAESILAAARDGLAILDGYRIVFVNDAFARMLGRTREEVLGSEYPRYLPPQSAGWTDLRALADIGFAEMEMRRADDGLVRVEVSISPVIYRGRSCLQLAARDVSERYALQRQAAQTQRLQSIGQMAAGVAHDFNNGLMAIIGNVSVARALVARASPEDLEKASKRLAVAEQAAMDAAATVRRLQIYSKPAPDTIETVDLHDLAREVRLILRPLWHDSQIAKGTQIRVEVSGASPMPVEASPAELREAITNLVTNAVHAMPDGGSVRLTTALEDGEAVLLVADTGSGMPPQTVDHIFEPFFTTKGKLGTGLGLFVTAGIIKHHGGRIAVDSQVGKGTTFKLHFPLAVARSEKEEAALPALPAGLRALLVEDEPQVSEATAGMLETAGLQVATTANAHLALEALAAEQFDLLISDTTLPEMTGVDLARAVHARYPELPIILISGWLEARKPPGEGDPDEFASATLSKPLTNRALLEAIHAALPRPVPTRRPRRIEPTPQPGPASGV
jgi:PAS domain S-box-containing protein